MKILLGDYDSSPRKEYIRIDPWDTWDMHITLGKIILPMLKQMRKDMRGAGHVDNEDVPAELRRPEGLDKWVTDEHHFDRWEYMLDEMIYAFEHLLDDSWEKEYKTGHLSYTLGPEDDDGTCEMIFDRSNYHVDYEGLRRVWDRIDRGLLMFGKYYRNLWD